MKKTNSFPALLACALVAPVTLHALQPVVVTLVETGATAFADERSTAYADGTRAINEGRWSDATAIFSKIATQGGDRADAALYWKAYAENKQGQPDRALETCASLRQTDAKSRWLSECDALRIEIRGAGAHAAQTSSNPDDELKLLALNALMQQDEARALPAIQQILNGNGSDRLKEKALFVLAQSNSPQAQQTLGQIARGQTNPALQLRAIKMYAAVGGKRSVDTLADIYQHSSDVNIKRAILQSYMMTGSSDKLLIAARGEQNPELVKSAVRSLGAMGATQDLATLYRETKSEEAKMDILSSLVAAGPKGVEFLQTIASTEQNPELRRRAIRNLGVAGGSSAAPSLVSAYQGTSDADSKRAAVDGLFLSGSAHQLIELARSEKDPQLKQMIVSKLSLLHNKEASDYMLEILNK
jgi:hypothetical protein